MKSKGQNNAFWSILLSHWEIGGRLVSSVSRFLGGLFRRKPYDVLGALCRIWTVITMLLFIVDTLTPWLQVPKVVTQGYLVLLSGFVLAKETYRWGKKERLKNVRVGEIYVAIWWLFFLIISGISMFDERYQCPDRLFGVAVGVLGIYIFSLTSKTTHRCVRRARVVQRKKSA